LSGFLCADLLLSFVTSAAAILLLLLLSLS
jgi:hypothetical protein